MRATKEKQRDSEQARKLAQAQAEESAARAAADKLAVEHAAKEAAAAEAETRKAYRKRESELRQAVDAVEAAAPVIEPDNEPIPYDVRVRSRQWLHGRGAPDGRTSRPFLR